LTKTTTKKPASNRWKGGPKPQKRFKPDPKPVPPVEVPPKPTMDELMVQLTALFDEVDQYIRSLERGEFGFTRYEARKQIAERDAILVGICEHLGAPRFDAWQTPALAVREAIAARLGQPAGTEPTSWARPAEVFVWIGYVPCRALWGGWLDPSVTLLATDPRELFPSATAGFSTGNAEVMHGETPRAMIRRGVAVATRTNRFRLATLTADAKKAVAEEMAKPEQAWALAELKRGRKDAIPLPKALQSVQPSFFG
jgi:hypothetical protein